MAKQERYFIGPRLLADIREVITRVDAIPMTTSGAEQPVRHQHMGRRGGGGALYRGTFTGTWNIGESKAVTFIGSTNTQSVMNYSSPIVGQTNATQSLNVIFGSVMGTVSAVEIQHMGRRGSGGGFHIATFTGAWSKNTAKVVTLTSDTNSTIQALNVFASIDSSNNPNRKCAIAEDGTAWYLIQAECP